MDAERNLWGGPRHPRQMKNLVPGIAAQQFSVFTAAQAMSAGASYSEVRYRRRTGEWLVVAGRGLVERGTTVGDLQRASAACLTWPAGVICRESAAQLWGLPIEPSANCEAVDVQVGNRMARMPGLVQHRVGSSIGLGLAAREIAWRGNIRMTSKTITIIDCLSLMEWSKAERLAAWVLSRKLLSDYDIEDALRSRKGRSGHTQYRVMVSERLLPRAASVKEVELQTLLRDAGLDGWRANAQVEVRAGQTYCVDILFKHECLIVEMDGMSFHGTSRRKADLERHQRLVAAGYTVLHFTPADLSDGFAILDRIATSLRRGERHAVPTAG